MSTFPPSSDQTKRILDTQLYILLENINDGFVVLDTHWCYIYVNRAAEIILQSKREGILGKNIWEVFPEAVDIPFWKRFYEAADTQTMVEFEAWYPSLLKWFHVRVYPSIVGALGMFTDMTERKKADEVRPKLAAIVESSDDAILGKTVEGIITSWNEAAKRIYGYTSEEVVGQSITLLFPPDRQDEFALIMERIKRGERIDHYETRRVRKDGSIIPVSITVSPIKDVTGRIIGASAIARDITEQKKAQERTQFLSELSKVLASSLDYQETLANIARLVVPQLADWFAVDLVDAEGHFELIEVDHSDPNKVQWARELRSRFPLDPNASIGVPNVVRTGRSELYPELTDAMLVAAARTEEELTIARQVGFTSVIHVPLENQPVGR